MSDEDDDGIVGPKPCYWCGKPRDGYTGILCEECREKALEIKRKQDAARPAGGTT